MRVAASAALALPHAARERGAALARLDERLDREQPVRLAVVDNLAQVVGRQQLALRAAVDAALEDCDDLLRVVRRERRHDVGIRVELFAAVDVAVAGVHQPRLLQPVAAGVRPQPKHDGLRHVEPQPPPVAAAQVHEERDLRRVLAVRRARARVRPLGEARLGDEVAPRALLPRLVVLRVVVRLIVGRDVLRRGLRAGGGIGRRGGAHRRALAISRAAMVAAICSQPPGDLDLI